jgi:hypothetical protein
VAVGWSDPWGDWCHREATGWERTLATFLIDYDLNKPEKDYPKLIDHIKSYPNWCRYLMSSWMIKTDRTTTQVRDDMRAFIDANDDLIVVDVTADSAAWYGLSDEISNWIKNNL